MLMVVAASSRRHASKTFLKGAARDLFAFDKLLEIGSAYYGGQKCKWYNETQREAVATYFYLVDIEITDKDGQI
jgi:hypothetical protein